MTAHRAARHWGSLSLVAALGLAAGACGGTQARPATGPVAAGEMGMKVDRSRCDERGKQVVVTDTNGDKKPDVTKMYDKRGDTQVLACKQVDLNYDNKVDIVNHYDAQGALHFEEFDLDFDGRYDLWSYYQNGKRVREEMDTNYDNRPDLVKYYEADKLVRVERDTDNNGRVDEWQYFEGGKLDRIGYDTTGAGRADKWDRAPEDSLPAAAGVGTGGAAEGATPAAAAAPAAGAPPPPAAPAPPSNPPSK